MILNTNKIKYLTIIKGITEKELLIAAGLNSDLITVKRRLGGGKITPTTAAKLANVLECDLAELIGDPKNTIVIFDTEALHQLAYSRGLTEKRLLEKANLTTCLLTKARSKKSLPTPTTAAKLASILECDPAEFIKIHEEALPANNISEGVELCKE